MNIMGFSKNEFLSKFPYVDLKLPYQLRGDILIENLEKAALKIGFPYSEIPDYEIGFKMGTKSDAITFDLGTIRTSKISREESQSKIRFYYEREDDEADLKYFLKEFLEDLGKDDPFQD